MELMSSEPASARLQTYGEIKKLMKCFVRILDSNPVPRFLGHLLVVLHGHPQLRIARLDDGGFRHRRPDPAQLVIYRFRFGLPDFSLFNIPKWGKIDQIVTKLPKGHKLYQIAVLYSK
jgi:hypothetical protein